MGPPAVGGGMTARYSSAERRVAAVNDEAAVESGDAAIFPGARSSRHRNATCVRVYTMLTGTNIAVLAPSGKHLYPNLLERNTCVVTE